MPKKHPPFGKYVLNIYGKPELCLDPVEWALWFEAANRTVAYDNLGELGRVSTVFLGFDHNFSRYGPPILWETMVFDGPLNGEMHRFTSKKSAETKHIAIVRELWTLAEEAKRQEQERQYRQEQERKLTLPTVGKRERRIDR